MTHPSDELLSSFVDDALTGAQRDEVATHLAGCLRCRDEVASLRRVQHLLGAGRHTPRQGGLNDRLVSIAGEQAHQPLWIQAAGPGERIALPSTRRARRRNIGSALMLLSVMVVGLVGVGWAAAPPPNPEIINPVATARAEFAQVAAQRPFVMPSAVVMWALSADDLAAYERGGAISAIPVTDGAPLTDAEARSVLTAAEQTPHITDYSSREVVHTGTATGHLTMRVTVEHRAAQGTRIDLTQADGSPWRSAFVQHADDAMIGLAVELSGRRDQTVSGRDAILVEAHRGDRVVARWWVDRSTGMQLAQETYGIDGRVHLQAVVEELAVDRHEFLAHTPPRLVRPSAAADLRLTQVDEMRAAGWSCHSELAGLSLTKLGSDPGTAVHTTYSDGASAVTVRQERGTIVEAPAGFSWDDEVGAYRRDGVTTMMIWQSKDTVFTVVTDGSAELAAVAVAELPHDQPVLRTRVGRVQEGWQHIVRTVLGG